jgi:hypothetical protein
MILSHLLCLLFASSCELSPTNDQIHFIEATLLPEEELEDERSELESSDPILILNINFTQLLILKLSNVTNKSSHSDFI